MLWAQSAPSSEAGFFSWFKDPVPSRQYSAEDAEQDPLSQAVVKAGDVLYFIDQGHVFEKVLASGQTTCLIGANNAAAILVFKNVLVALRENGKVSVWNPRKKWVDIGSGVRRLAATRSGLVALTKDGELQAFQSASGPVTWLLFPVDLGNAETGSTSQYDMAPTFNSDRAIFSDVGVQGVVGIEPVITPEQGRDIRILFRDPGFNFNYSRVEELR